LASAVEQARGVSSGEREPWLTVADAWPLWDMITSIGTPALAAAVIMPLRRLWPATSASMPTIVARRRTIRATLPPSIFTAPTRPCRSTPRRSGPSVMHKFAAAAAGSVADEQERTIPGCGRVVVEHGADRPDVVDPERGLPSRGNAMLAPDSGNHGTDLCARGRGCMARDLVCLADGADVDADR